MALLISNAAYEKDLPLAIRKLINTRVIFLTSAGGKYVPVTTCRDDCVELADTLNFGWKIWSKQEKRINKLKDLQNANDNNVTTRPN